MKRLVAFVLVLAILLCGCGNTVTTTVQNLESALMGTWVYRVYSGNDTLILTFFFVDGIVDLGYSDVRSGLSGSINDGTYTITQNMVKVAFNEQDFIFGDEDLMSFPYEYKAGTLKLFSHDKKDELEKVADAVKESDGTYTMVVIEGSSLAGLM